MISIVVRKMKRYIALIVGTRPNFVKASPLLRAMKEERLPTMLIHTGQHYDYELSKAFFEDFALEKPDLNLGVGSGEHGEQTGKIMMKLEDILQKRRPLLVVVFGDVNSTLAASIVASKMGIPIAHVEAGLRSYDRTMPEEINRVLTDLLADLLFIPSKDAEGNLKKEGIKKKKIFFVGNIMIDSLRSHLEAAKKREYYRRFGVKKKGYWILTLHRPGNVDKNKKMVELFAAFDSLRKERPIIFPVHPRTKKMIRVHGLRKRFPWALGGENFHIISPLGYIDFLSLECHAEGVVTDSGGIQEETSFLNIPCLTIRDNTERPVTIEAGTNILCTTPMKFTREVARILRGKGKTGTRIPLWDGNTAGRIVRILSHKYEAMRSSP